MVQNLTLMQNNSNKKPACYAPWITTYESAIGKINPCCEMQGWMLPNKERKSISFEERWNDPAMVKFRETLLTGELPDGCGNCVHNEKNGATSLRQEYDSFEEHVELDKFKLIHMDYRESNVCNMSCKMCGSSLSSTHAQIEGVYGKTGVMTNPHNLQMYLDRLDEVQLVQCLGGEPMLTESMWTTIKEVKRRGLEGQLDISIVTNGSLLHKNEDSLIDILEGFKYVDIAVSIDCIGDQHNYWRQKNTWAQIEENCKILYEWKQDKENVNCAVRTAIGWPNAYAARDVFDKFKDMDVEQRWNLVSYPMGLSLPMLPQEDLEKLVEHWKDYPEVADMFANTVSSPNVFETVGEIIKLNRIQENRDMTFEQAFPETVHVYNNASKHRNNPYLG